VGAPATDADGGGGEYERAVWIGSAIVNMKIHNAQCECAFGLGLGFALFPYPALALCKCKCK
jgi:hypothetical protein